MATHSDTHHEEFHYHAPGLQHQFEDMKQQEESVSIGMWMFLVQEIMFFGGLFTAYLVFRSLCFPLAFAEASNHLNAFWGGLNTLVLIVSSLTMALAVFYAQKGNRNMQVIMIILTMIFGATFLGVKAIEYTDKYNTGLIPVTGWNKKVKAAEVLHAGEPSKKDQAFTVPLIETRAEDIGGYPHYTHAETGVWVTTAASGWPSGFFPGALWLMYQQTAHPTWRSHAQTWQAGIESQKTRTSTHDLGFMLFNSFGNGYRLTGNDAYRQVVLTAADSLAKRYCERVGCIRSSGSQTACDGTEFRVIIDNMMNLELLLWASKNGGNPEWYNMAVSHAHRTAEEHVRPDGSTYQDVIFTPSTGAVNSRCSKQGYSCESTWSRGQAWALYGFTMAYRYTRDVQFLNTARATADYFIASLPPDKVPYWDFEAPGIPNEPRDSSAAAIAASGLLELSQLDTDSARRQRYLNTAKQILTSLSSPAYLARGTPNQAILLHGTYYKDIGNYDTGLIYGDYYFLEAMLRYRWVKATGFILAVSAVTASAHDGNRPENTLDNNFSTRWSAQGDGQWIRFDLGVIKTVKKIAIAWHLGHTRSTKFDVQTSRNGATWTTGFKGLSSGTTTKQETYDLLDGAGRYLRIVGHGNSLSTWNSVTEVDIYGN